MNGTRRKVCWSVRACIYNEGTREGERKKVELVLSKIFKWVPDASANYAPILVLGFSMFANLIRVPWQGMVCKLFQSWPFVGRAVTTKVNIDFYVKWMDLFILQQKFIWCKLLFRFFRILSDKHGSINRDNFVEYLENRNSISIRFTWSLFLTPLSEKNRNIPIPNPYSRTHISQSVSDFRTGVYVVIPSHIIRNPSTVYRYLNAG